MDGLTNISFNEPNRRLAPVITVSELNRAARNLLENGFPPVWVAGEISNLTIAASGHAYFSLKDRYAQIRAVMFRARVAQIGFPLREGMQIEAHGTVSLYEARGDYQIQLDCVREAGLGRLFEDFSRLKSRLESEGLFASSHKKSLPAWPKTIGILTSPQAAALHDVITTLQRRMPSIPVILYPSQVQGEAAPAQIVAALNKVYQRQEVDVLLVCRGGGSIEDLWAFNDERVARMLAQRNVPIVTGIGHETDFTIADFVADVRAPTPTAAAELVSPDRQALRQRLQHTQQCLLHAQTRAFNDISQRLDRLSARLISPSERLQRRHDQLQDLANRLNRALQSTLQQARLQTLHYEHALHRATPSCAKPYVQLETLRQRQHHAFQRQLTRYQHQLTHASSCLMALNPNAVLARGYAIVRDPQGHILKNPHAAPHGSKLHIQLAEGELAAIAWDTLDYTQK